MKKPGKNHILPPSAATDLLHILEERFHKHMERHEGCRWEDVRQRLDAAPDKLRSLHHMEKTGGEPDVISFCRANGTFLFVDCSPETPIGRRSLCYDRQGLESRKEHRPDGTAIDAAGEFGTSLLTEDQYHLLQTLGNFDRKTSSWLATPQEIRALGGAIFGDHRYGRTFIYHNGAQSYYASRGFRAALEV